MKFKVGPWVYRVSISSGDVFDRHGNLCDGLCNWSDRSIVIRGSLPIEQRYETLVHEIEHAWQHHFGVPSDAEGLAGRNASFAVDVARQLERMGGINALARLTCRGICEDGADPETPRTTFQVQCPVCQGKILVSDLRQSDPRFDASLRSLVVIRHFRCEHCGAKARWNEECTSMGIPNGCIIGEPVVSRASSSLAAD